MWPVVSSCDTTTYGFGDNTAGPIWRATLPGQSLYGSYTNVTNYPFGDDLSSPVNGLFLLQIPTIKAFQAVAGPICGYNLLNISSFLVSSLVMFGFILFLTRNKWIALFAGYAATFSPYYQMKVGGHFSYGFQAIFIALIWLFFRLIKYRRKRDSVYLGLAWIFALYLDPYFSLFSAIVLLALGAAWAIVNYRSLLARKAKSFFASTQGIELKRILLAGLIMIAVSVPLLAMYGSSSSQITGDVAAARGNVIAEAKACSNWPHEYLVPFVLHPLFKSIFGGQSYQSAIDSLKQDFPCGIGEDTVGLSLSLVFVAIIGLMIIFWEKINRRRLGLAKILPINSRIVFLSLILIGLVAIVMALPPVRLKGIIPTPSYELLTFTSTWRTLSRFYMLVNISLVALVSIILAMTWRAFPKNKNLLLVLFSLLWIGVFVEYQAFPPLKGNTMSTFNYAKDAPAAYTWLRDQSNIKVVAEYPLEQYGKESDAMSYYLTMQAIHKKKLFNSAISHSPQERIKDSLKNLKDPQTMRVLKANGVDAVIVHGIPEADLVGLNGARVIHTSPQAVFNINSHSPVVKEDNIVILSLDSVSKIDYYLDLDKGFYRNVDIIKSVIDWKYEAANKAEIIIKRPGVHLDDKNNVPVKVCFKAQMSVPTEHTNLLVRTDGITHDLGEIDGTLREYSFDAITSVVLLPANGHNIRLTGLGCPNG